MKTHYFFLSNVRSIRIECKLCLSLADDDLINEHKLFRVVFTIPFLAFYLHFCIGPYQITLELLKNGFVGE